MKKYKFDNIVAETLLIPLYARAMESKREKDAILRDPTAQQLIDNIDYDYSIIERSPKSEVGCVVRGAYFDNAVKRFLERNPKAVGINIGCGLDTRYQRLGEPEGLVYYDVDLPMVMDIRSELIPKSPNNHYVAASILDTEWMDSIKAQHPDASFIITIEGVLMYFHESQVKNILHNLVSRFSVGELWFDTCGKLIASGVTKPDSLRKHAAQIRSGITDGRDVEVWEPSLKLIEQVSYPEFHRNRWGLFMYLFSFLPRSWSFPFSSMMGYKIGGV